MTRQRHWDAIYQAKAETEVSWFEEEPATSVALIRSVLPAGGSVLEIGGGASRLVDRLLPLTTGEIAVVDISAVALERVKKRLGESAGRVRWIVGDVTELASLGQFDVWHDRAVFHFLTTAGERQRYVALAEKSVKPGGHIVLGVFAPDGPDTCSGLNVCRYDGRSLAAEFGTSFRLVAENSHRHKTPGGNIQSFYFGVFQHVPQAGEA